MKLSFNNPKAKTALIILTVLSCIIGVVGAFFKIQPVYFCGMGAMVIMLVVTVIAFVNASKEDKAEEINARFEEAKKFFVTEEEYKAQQTQQAQQNGEEFENIDINFYE